MRQLTVFLSSTIPDFADVRESIGGSLKKMGVGVLRSEHVGFPVRHGFNTVDACLDDVRSSNVIVTLVGMRYGSASDREGKSVTWCEYEEARRSEVYPIVLIRKDMMAIAQKISVRRAELTSHETNLGLGEQDARLAAEFPDVLPYVQNLPAQQRFIDAILSARVDNWVKTDWTGIPADAVDYIVQRLGDYLVSTREVLNASIARADATRFLLETSTLTFSEVIKGHLTADAAINRILSFCDNVRDSLFGFDRTKDRHNFMLYRREGDVLVPVARQTHPAIRTRGRSWRIGEGHAGVAIQQQDALVTPFLPDTAVWVPTTDEVQDQSDRGNYASAVSVPLQKRADGTAGAVFIVTSSRRDHFSSGDQPEALICVAVGRILDLFLDLEGGR